MQWTEKQLEAIELRNKNMLVAAAAGSGKTAVLVERIKRMVIEERVPVDRLLVVTFTNKAAAEMKEKIITALTEEIEKRPDDSSYLRGQLNNIYRASICTFHSFALSVIRQYYYVIGVDPGMRIADEAENAIMKSDAIDAVFDKRFETDGDNFKKFLDKYSGGKSFESIKGAVLAAYEKLMSIPDAEAWIAEHIESLKLDESEFEKSELGKALISEVMSQLAFAEDGFESTYNMLIRAEAVSVAEKVYVELDYIRQNKEKIECGGLNDIREFVLDFPQIRMIARKDDADKFENVKNSSKKLHDKAKKRISDIKNDYFAYELKEYLNEMSGTYDMTKYFCMLVHDFKQIYSEAKAEKKCMDFSDIEHMALEILRDENVSSELREKFIYIYIDEYQDSNLIQEELISRICRSNNLFMVGDVKQSIYKFRLAEPEIFVNKYNRYRNDEETDSVKLDLNTNFRSKNGVVSAVNHIFENSMDGYDDDAALHQGALPEKTEGMGYTTDMYLFCSDENDDLPDEIAEMKGAEVEAHAAVRIIKESLGKDIFDVKKSIYRKLEKKDIVVLMRGVKSTGAVFRKILTDNDIPAYMDDSDGYFDTVEIDVFLNLLKLVDNFRQDIPLISVLYSPIFGFTLEELSEIRYTSTNRRSAFYKAFLECAYRDEGSKVSEKCKKAKEMIDGYVNEVNSMPLSEFIWKLMHETGYYIYIGGLPSGQQRQANLRALADKAAEFQTGRSGSLYEFLRYIDNMRKRGVQTGQSMLISESDDVVRIMTIHKSKGLEYPMVIIAGMGKGFNYKRDKDMLSIHKDIGMGLELVNKEEHWRKRTLMQKLIDKRMERESAEEELRILYVGCTRAMDKLVFLGAAKQKRENLDEFKYLNPRDIISASSFLDIVMPLTGETIQLHALGKNYITYNAEPENAAMESLKKVFGNEGTEHDDILKKSDNYAEVKRRLEFEYPNTELERKSKYSVTEIAQQMHEMSENCEHEEKSSDNMSRDALYINKTLAVPLFAAGKKVITAAEKGTLYHSVIEHVDFIEIGRCMKNDEPLKAADEYVARLIEDLVERELMLEEEAAVIDVKRITALVTSSLGIRIAAAAESGRLYREVPFTLKTVLPVKNDNVNDHVLVQGIIDCYFEEESDDGTLKAVLIDFKTNYAVSDNDEERLRDKYRWQIALYKEAIEKIKGMSVDEAYLWLFSLDKAVSM